MHAGSTAPCHLRFGGEFDAYLTSNIIKAPEPTQVHNQVGCSARDAFPRFKMARILAAAAFFCLVMSAAVAGALTESIASPSTQQSTATAPAAQQTTATAAATQQITKTSTSTSTPAAAPQTAAAPKSAAAPAAAPAVAPAAAPAVTPAATPAASAAAPSSTTPQATVSVASVASSTPQQEDKPSVPSFYDVLKADKAHRLIVQAIDNDVNGKTKAMLQMKVPVTAFVPTDSAFIMAALKHKMGASPADMKKMMSNTCLIGAILKQHIIPGVYTVEQLKGMYGKPSLLVTKKYDVEAKKQINVQWPLRFKVNADNDLTVASAAVDAVTKKPNINGTVVAPMDVRAGSGIIHNINQLMLPTTNITRLLQITGCTNADLPIAN